VGLPLVVIGSITAAASAHGGGALFWAGALLAGIGVALFLSGLIER